MELTVQNIVKELETNLELQQEISEFWDRYDELCADYSINTKDVIVQEFSTKFKSNKIFAIYLSQYAKSSIDSRSYIDYSTRKYLQNIVVPTIGINAKGYTPLLSDATYKKIIWSKHIASETARRSALKFDDSAKELKLDMFSLKVFEQHLKSSKKLSGKDAARYLNKLPSSISIDFSEADKTIKDKYAKVIWDNVQTKSLELVKAIRNLHGYRNSTTPNIDRAFGMITTNISAESWATEVMFTYNYFTSKASKYKLPLTILSTGITEAVVHDYITGLPKKGAMSSYDIAYAFDKLKVLHFDIKYDTLNCPYYQLAIDQLMAELARPENMSQITSTTSFKSEIEEYKVAISALESLQGSLDKLTINKE